MNQFRAGDIVLHAPTQEKWVLACAHGNDVMPCGWPETLAHAADCTMVNAATDQEHRTMLESLAAKSIGRRSEIARHQLSLLNEAFVGAGI